MKFYKRDPDRALAGMAELTLKQRGAYNSLLDLLYSRDGDVPDDDVRVSRMISCHWREWATLKSELIAAGKVWVEGGKLHARRVQDTIKEASRFSQEQSKRASRRWEEPEKPIKNNDTSMRARNASTATATPIEEDTSLRSVAAAPKRTKGTRLSTDWTLPIEWGQWAQQELGLQPRFIREQAAGFRDYWVSKPSNATKLDWEATFRNWMRKASEQVRARGSPQSGRQPTMLELNAQLLAEMEAADAGRDQDNSQLEQAPRNLPAVR